MYFQHVVTANGYWFYRVFLSILWFILLVFALNGKIAFMSVKQLKCSIITAGYGSAAELQMSSGWNREKSNRCLIYWLPGYRVTQPVDVNKKIFFSWFLWKKPFEVEQALQWPDNKLIPSEGNHWKMRHSRRGTTATFCTSTNARGQLDIIGSETRVLWLNCSCSLHFCLQDSDAVQTV